MRYNILFLLLLACISSCSHGDLEVIPDNATYRPAADFIKNNYDLTLFYAAVEKAGLVDELNGAGPFTILAPGNNAFNEIGIRKAEDFDAMDKDSLRNMVLFHVINRRLMVSDIPANGVDIRYATLYEGKELYTSIASFDVNGGKAENNLYFNGSFAEKKEVTLTNGVLYVLDKVMKYTPGTVQEWLLNQNRYNILIAGFKKFGYWDRLAEDGPFTVLAPDDDAFITAGMDLHTLDALSVDNYIGARLFGIYILPKQRYFISDFFVFQIINSDAQLYKQIPDDSWYFSMWAEVNRYYGTPPTFYVRVWTAKSVQQQIVRTVTANIPARADYLSDNGIVHIIPEVLVLPSEAEK